MHSPAPVLVVSIDGVAPSHVDPSTMPRLCRLARQGASTFDARTVDPPVTLPAHTSMLRGVTPAVHGITDNEPRPLDGCAPSFLSIAREAARPTFATLSWLPIDAVIERTATAHRHLLDGGYDPADDRIVVDRACALLGTGPTVGFVYLCAPDLAGHAEGWGSAAYRQALRDSDDLLGDLIDAVDRIAPDAAVLVTTDHGGHGTHHDGTDPIDEVIFVVLRSPGVASASTWSRAVSIVDVAPTVAALIGAGNDPAWSGVSLLDDIVSIADVLEADLASMQAEHYGEDVTMLEHSLQTARTLADRGATEELQIAGLLHDIGHLRGPAGAWGRPDHAHDGALHLQAWLPAAVVEPIRGHVDAKRHLVATDPAYAGELSEASVQTLRQQGGPFSATESERFTRSPWANDALELRRADDHGKQQGAPPESLDAWSGLLRAVLEREMPAAEWLRDACRCATCRDAGSGQRLLTADDLAGWRVRGMRDGAWVLTHAELGDHAVHLEAVTPRGYERPLESEVRSHTLPAGLDAFRRDLVEQGLALGSDLGVDEGAVLALAAELGHVRTTNYGDLFDVRNEAAATNLAYTSLGLPLHTDNPYRDPVPTVQLLHCLVAAPEGGRSHFVDGVTEAEALRVDDPQAFAVLRSTLVSFDFRADNTWLHARRPVIETDAAGRVIAVAVNHRSMQQLDAEADHDRWYRSYRRFVSRLEASRHAVDLLLQPGQVVAFDNRRILHARTAFDTAHARHLQGCYIDIDAVRSAVAVARVRR